MATPELQTDDAKILRAKTESPRKGLWQKLRIRNTSLIAFLALSVTGSLLVIPRPTYPQILPLPKIDRPHARAREKEEVTRAARALRGTLSRNARVVGEQVRRIGLALSHSNQVDSALLDSLRTDTLHLLEQPATKTAASGIESLLDLRALQAEIFLQSVNKWERTQKVDTELRELGGPFHEVAAHSWRGDDGHLVLDRDELRLLFRIHWGKVTGVHGRPAFGPSLEELRRYYGTNLEHPSAPGGEARGLLLSQMSFARALGELDPDYPGLLAQGIVQLRMGESFAAERTLAAYLAEHPDGAWATLARNHHLLATAQANALTDAGL